MTAYRQRALSLRRGAARGARSGRATCDPRSPTPGPILLNNVYGWFAPVSRGVYELTEAGRAALRAGRQRERRL